MARKTTRKFYRYTLQAHNPANDYNSLFTDLRSVPRSRRIAAVGYERIFVSDVSSIDGGILVRALGIRSEKDYMTFDESDFSTSDSSLPDNKRFAVAAHGLYIPDTRKFIFEYVKSGPKASDVMTAIQDVLQRNNQALRSLRLELVPIVDERFLQDVSRLDRIRVVRIDVAEPNTAWTDWDDPLHELGEESGASRMSIEATAPRSQSLKKTKGIVKLLKDALKQPNSHVEKAVVQGRPPGASSDKTLRTDRDHEFDNARVDIDSGGSANVISATAALNEISAKIRSD